MDLQRVHRNVTIPAAPTAMVTYQTLGDADSPENDTMQSGKKYGTVYLVKGAASAHYYMLALGSEKTSVWVAIGSTYSITPS